LSLRRAGRRPEQILDVPRDELERCGHASSSGTAQQFLSEGEPRWSARGVGIVTCSKQRASRATIA
jgi:hypothetical protein